MRVFADCEVEASALTANALAGIPGGLRRGGAFLEELATGFSSEETAASGDSGTIEPSTSDSEFASVVFFPRLEEGALFTSLGLTEVFRVESLPERPVRAVANSGSESDVN